MIEKLNQLAGQIILSIEIRTEDDQRNGHMGYDIEIITDKGQVLISGCHDMSPDVTITPTPEKL